MPVWLQSFADYMDSCNGRDNVMKLLYYSARCAADISKCSVTQHKLNNFSDQIETCRTVLRLFDSVPTLCYTIKYGLGTEEVDRLSRWCGITLNALDLLSLLSEHVAWAADAELIQAESGFWWCLSSLLWALYECVLAVKYLRHYFLFRGCNPFSDRKNREISDEVHLTLCLSLCVTDFINAVNWLPSGILWAGKLRNWHIGALGIISSLVQISVS